MAALARLQFPGQKLGVFAPLNDSPRCIRSGTRERVVKCKVAVCSDVGGGGFYGAVAPGMNVLTFSAWGKDDRFRGRKPGEECSFDPTLTKGVARENDGPASVGPDVERAPDMSD